MSHASTRGDSVTGEVVDFHAPPLLRVSKEETQCRDANGEKLARDVSGDELVVDVFTMNTPIACDPDAETAASETPTSTTQGETLLDATPPIAPHSEDLSSSCQGELGSFSRKLRDDFFRALADYRSKPQIRLRVTGAPIRRERERYMERHAR